MIQTQSMQLKYLSLNKKEQYSLNQVNYFLQSKH